MNPIADSAAEIRANVVRIMNEEGRATAEFATGARLDDLAKGAGISRGYCETDDDLRARLLKVLAG
jgi:hypothetical protein